MAIITDIADAVAAALNGAPEDTFSQEFQAVRRNEPTFDLEQLKDLVVCVAPKSISETPASRSSFQTDYGIDVGVLKRVADQGEQDGLLTFMDELRRFFRWRTLEVGNMAATCIKTENEPPYWPNHLREMRQFTSVLTLTFRVIA
jgi:hypothetical protein